MGSLTHIHLGRGSWPSDVAGSPRCEVYVAHRRHLQDRHRTVLDRLERRVAAGTESLPTVTFTWATVLLRAVTGRATGVDASATVTLS